VNSIIAQAFPITLSLVIGAAVIWFTIGVALRHRVSSAAAMLLDRFFTVSGLFLYSMPSFVLGLLLLELLYYQLSVHGFHWFPASGYTSPSQGIFGSSGMNVGPDTDIHRVFAR
jgi:peptide/nickel transport system permease protein